MWPLVSQCVDESIVVSLDDAAAAMKLAAERCHVIAEGAAACAVAAALSPQLRERGHEAIVAVVSGGNIDLSRFATSSARARSPDHSSELRHSTDASACASRTTA